jgi:hypothetical protein
MSQDQYAFEILLVFRGSTFTNSLCHCFVQESKDRKNVEHGSLTLPFQSVEPNDLALTQYGVFNPSIINLR